MNIQFNYLYRDGANYKNRNEVVFCNPSNLPLKEIELAIANSLIDGQWFVAKNWGLLDMHFKEFSWDADIDHDWHEFTSVEETMREPTEEYTIESFLLLINKTLNLTRLL